jgi:glutamate dehydrogenase
MAAANCDARAFVAGYEAARTVLDIPALWDAVAALDGKVSAAGQMALFRQLAAVLRGATFWLARRAGRERLQVADLVARYGEGFRILRGLSPGVLGPAEQASVAGRVQQLVAAGAPEVQARAIAALQPLTTAADLIDLAEASSWPLPAVARLYHATGAAFAFDRVRQAAGAYAVGDSFERMALRRLLEDLLAQQADLTRTLMAFAGSSQSGEDAAHAREAAVSWAAMRREKADIAKRTIGDIEASGDWTFAKLTIANAALRELAEQAGRKKAR